MSDYSRTDICDVATTIVHAFRKYLVEENKDTIGTTIQWSFIQILASLKRRTIPAN